MFVFVDVGGFEGYGVWFCVGVCFGGFKWCVGMWVKWWEEGKFVGVGVSFICVMVYWGGECVGYV